MEDLVLLVVACEACDCDASSDSDPQSKLKVNSNAYRQGWEQIFGNQKQESRTLH